MPSSDSQIGRLGAVQSALAALACLLSAFAFTPSAALAAARSAELVVDANTGEVLHADRQEEARFPASLTKMMTIYLAFEAIESGRLRETTPIRVSEEAASAPPTRLGLAPGSTIPLIDAIKSLITRSANDISVAIAEHLAGSEEKFAALMTRKARDLGMPRTLFRNASGLPDDEQVTTARDMLTLALRLQDHFPERYKLFSLRYSQFKGKSSRNHNNLLFKFQGTEGIKTGYTRASGFNLVASVRRGRRHVIAVVFGGRSASQRDARMQMLLSRGLQRASPVRSRVPVPMLVARAAPPARQPPPRTVELAATPRQPVLTQSPRAAIRPTQSFARPTLPPARPSHTPASAAAAVPAPRPATGALRFGANLPPGAPPSTLDRQAANIARGEDPHAAPAPYAAPPPPRYALQGPRPLSSGVASPASFGFEVQIGAFASASEAGRALDAARAAAAGTLAGLPSRAEPVRVASRVLYRARFGHLDAARATTVCNELRRRSFDCFVARAQ